MGCISLSLFTPLLNFTSRSLSSKPVHALLGADFVTCPFQKLALPVLDDVLFGAAVQSFANVAPRLPFCTTGGANAPAQILPRHKGTYLSSSTLAETEKGNHGTAC